MKTRLCGDRVIENGLLANTYEGFGVGNADVRRGSGPRTDGDTAWRWPDVTNRPYMYARTATSPDVERGIWNWTTGTAVAVDPCRRTRAGDDGRHRIADCDADETPQTRGGEVSPTPDTGGSGRMYT